MSQAEVCVIFNPTAGRGRAPQRMQGLREVLPAADFRPTSGPGEGEEIALRAAQAGCRAVYAAGGDGTVHEVANGLLRAGRPETALGVVPIGSANDYAHSLALADSWWLQTDRPLETRAVDIGVAEAGDGRRRFFINGLGLGFNGAVTLESRRVRGLQGVPLYTVALLRALWKHFAAPSMAVTIDGVTREQATLALTVALGRREGNFVLAPDARLDDGRFDYLHVGPIARWELLRYVPGMVTGRLPTDHPLMWRGLCQHVHVESTMPFAVHLDGELFCLPETGVRTLEATIQPAALRIEGRWPDSPLLSGERDYAASPA